MAMFFHAFDEGDREEDDNLMKDSKGWDNGAESRRVSDLTLLGFNYSDIPDTITRSTQHFRVEKTVSQIIHTAFSLALF